MTCAAASKIMMLDAVVEPDPANRLHFIAKAFDGPKLVAVGRACCRPSAALSDLVEKVYKIRCEEVRLRQKYKCAKCDGFKPLQVHHKTYRSHGRLDVPSNLIALCQACHEATHGRK